jgi:SulP family sulfate permease
MEWKNGISRMALNGGAGLVVAVFTVIASASYAALIFHGPLESYVARGLWMGLITAVVVGILVAVTSSYPGAIAIPQDRVAPILAILAGNVAAGMATSSPEQVCLVVVAAMILVTLITGFFLYSLGWLKLGNLIRYIPYPVIGGFLAGSGWLLVLGGLRVMLGHPVELNNLHLFFEPGALSQWMPGLLFGVLLFVAFRRAKHQLVMPAMLLLAILAFFAFVHVTGKSIAEVRQAGWLPALPPEGAGRPLTFFAVLNVASWSLIFHQINLLATILLTSVVSILLTASALELVAQQEIDLNTELRSAGMATFVAGLGGGMVGFHSLSMSRLALSMGTQSRWVGITSSLFCGLGLLFGAPLVACVPQFVRGGLLLFLGLIFLWEWVCEARRKLTKLDYGVVLMILA